MAKIRFRKVKLSKDNKKRLDQINEIIEEYQEQGYVLTLRQLYYQLVSRDVIPNKQTEYSKLSTLLKEGRMGGIVDWDAIEDRLRKPYTPASFESPKEILEAALNQFMLPRLKGQKNYVEVWVEKDALSGVLKRVTSQYHVPILVNRGYSSASAMFDSFNRFAKALEEESRCTILYLGDFDPSGLDMIRDIKDRILEFLLNDYWTTKRASEATDDEEEQDRLRDEYEDRDIECLLSKQDEDDRDEEPQFDVVKAWVYDRFEVVPIALTRQQIKQYNPPPNPAKRTDPRAKDFIDEHGSTSWEVDALKPEVLNELLTDAIRQRLDMAAFNKILGEEKKDKAKLKKIIQDTKW